MHSSALSVSELALAAKKKKETGKGQRFESRAARDPHGSLMRPPSEEPTLLPPQRSLPLFLPSLLHLFLFFDVRPSLLPLLAFTLAGQGVPFL